jgi:hypothetical protein
MIGNLLILFEAPALGLQLLIDGILIGPCSRSPLTAWRSSGA